MYKKEIEAYFENRRAEMLADISRLVKIKSLKGEPREGMPFGEGPAVALAEALKMAEEKGLAVKNFDNYVGTANLNQNETQLGILAHLDVMPEGSEWHYPPFAVTEEDGKIYGRGVADDKGPAVAALYAMCAAKAICPGMKKNARLILGCDEESGSGDIAYYFPIEPAPPYVFSPDSDFPIINVEKGRFSPIFSAKWEKETALPRVSMVRASDRLNVVPREAAASVRGIPAVKILPAAAEVNAATGVTFSVTEENGETQVVATGLSAHGARPENGNNALTALLQLLCSLPLADTPSARALKGMHALFPHGDTVGKTIGFACKDEVTGPLSLNFSKLDLEETGFAAGYDCRSPICADQQALLAILKQKLASFGASVEKEAIVPPHNTPEDSEFVQTLLRIYTEYTGNKGYCISIGGGTYVHNIEGGVAYGCAMPGVDNRMHGPDEFSIVDDLIMSAKIFTQAILDICG